MSDEEDRASASEDEAQAPEEAVEEKAPEPAPAPAPKEEAVEEKPKPKPQVMEDDAGPTEAEMFMQKKKAHQKSEQDDFLKDLEEKRREEKEKENAEIQELREKQIRRKEERVEEDRRMAERRVEEEARRKAEEAEIKRRKEEEELKRREKRAAATEGRQQMLSSIGKPNFVITKKDGSTASMATSERKDETQTKSKEQLEQEKQAILTQRLGALNLEGMDDGALEEKARELHALIYRRESEKYDLEERFKKQQYDMMELAERARQMSKGGKGKKGMQAQEDDKMAERFAGAPPKVEMFSKYERQKDKRTYVVKKVIFGGKTWADPVEKIAATRQVLFFNDKLPEVVEFENVPEAEPAAAPVQAEEEE